MKGPLLAIALIAMSPAAWAEEQSAPAAAPAPPTAGTPTPVPDNAAALKWQYGLSNEVRPPTWTHGLSQPAQTGKTPANPFTPTTVWTHGLSEPAPASGQPPAAPAKAAPPPSPTSGTAPKARAPLKSVEGEWKALEAAPVPVATPPPAPPAPAPSAKTPPPASAPAQ